MQTVLRELEIFHNYHVTECRKNTPNGQRNIMRMVEWSKRSI